MYNKTYDFYSQRELSVDESVDLFLKKHEATGEISSRRFYAKRMPTGRIDWSVGAIPNIQVEREPMVEINMPKHRFRELVEKEKWYGKLEDEADYYKRIVNKVREEEQIRANNPVLQKAWEKYKMLLELSR